MLDIIEHLKDPEEFMEELRFATGANARRSFSRRRTSASSVTRLLLLFGQFNYGKKGILDATHTRLFTFRSLRDLLETIRLQVTRSARDSGAVSEGAGH